MIELTDSGLAGIASAGMAGAVARQVLARHLGEEAVRDLGEGEISVRLESQGGQVVRIYETPDGETVTQPIYGVGFSDPEGNWPRPGGYAQEEERFAKIIRNEDPALSAWNPVTGLEPVLCRVCGETSDPRAGQPLVHRPAYPCAPVTERTQEDGRTSQVRDLVLLKSSNMREEVAAPRYSLQPWEVLEISVRAYQQSDALGEVPAGPVRECLQCLSVSTLPTHTPSHESRRCEGSDGFVMGEVNPAETAVAAVHLPGSRSLTDPDWYHLDGGWWVALEHTPGPEWADSYEGAVSLASVWETARTPTDRTPVLLTDEDRRQGRKVAMTLDRLAAYFRALDRPEVLHGITSLTQAIAVAVSRSWTGLEALHDEDTGAMFHAALGSGETCPVCQDRLPADLPPEHVLDWLARTIQAQMAGDGGPRVKLRVVRNTLAVLIRLRAGESVAGPDRYEDVYPLASQAVDLVNRHFLTSRDYRDRGYGEVPLADVARVLRYYHRYVREGGPL